MKQKRLVILLCFLLLFPIQLLAAGKTYNLGTLQKASITLSLNQTTLDAYQAFDGYYIPVSELKKAGCPTSYSSADKTVHIDLPSSTNVTTSSSLNLSGKSFSLYDSTVHIGHFTTHAIYSEGCVLIPLGALRQTFNITISNNQYSLSPKQELPVKANYTQITNDSNETLSLKLVDIFWRYPSTKGYIYKENTCTLAANETLERHCGELDDQTLYIATVIMEAKGDSTNYMNATYLGQVNNGLFNRYMSLKNAPVVQNYGEQTANPAYLQQFVNEKGLSSNTKYLVWTNIDSQHTYIFEGSKGNWTLLKNFLCSTGRDSTPTPKGTYQLTYKVSSFGQDHGYMCKNAFGFIGTSYLYHSILFDKTGSYLLEGRGVLGQKASQGCIRFSPENAEWFYNHLISGTTVYIN